MDKNEEIIKKKIVDKDKIKLKYIKLNIDTLVDIKPTNVSIFITLI